MKRCGLCSAVRRANGLHRSLASLTFIERHRSVYAEVLTSRTPFDTGNSKSAGEFMPTIQELKDSYDVGGHYNWDERGDEWSFEWGGTDMEWYGTLLPRIHAFIPTDSIVEIGCGFGRWTDFLKDACKQLTAIERVGEMRRSMQETFCGKQTRQLPCEQRDLARGRT